METPNKIQTAVPTPEQLLKRCELELQEGRRAGKRQPRRHASILAVGIFFILVGAGVALFYAQHVLVEVRQRQWSSGRPGSSEAP